MKKTVLLLFLLCATSVLARSGHITGLSVIDENDSIGGIADFYLEIKPGTGAVYIESFPLTKLDTQISTRFAKETACQRASVDCSEYDFFYIVNVRSSVIGGPSAGGAIAVLTYALLEDLPIDNKTAMTGSILSGGVIGPVGGIRAKVAGAATNGFERVLIPAWETNYTGIPLDDKYNISVVRIKTLDDAIYYFTGENKSVETDIDVPSGYTSGMEEVSRTLCERAASLGNGLNSTNETLAAQQQYEYGINATKNKSFYSAASLCFSSSLTSQRIRLENATPKQRRALLQNTIEEQGRLQQEIAANTPTTIANLEMHMIIAERLEDVQQAIAQMDLADPPADELAYVYERLKTAQAWYTMVDKVDSKVVDINPDRLAISCMQKVQEAQERINYLSYLYPEYTGSLEESLRRALVATQNQEYTLCLLQASQAKAEANALMTALYVPEQEFPSLVEQKLIVSRNQLAKQSENDVFPILAYSYAEYSEELLERQPYSAALYAEYSLELSNLDIYFPPKKPRVRVNREALLVFTVGACLGAISGIIISQLFLKSESRRPKKVTFARNLPGKKR
jgi:uncharacterized protein